MCTSRGFWTMKGNTTGPRPNIRPRSRSKAAPSKLARRPARDLLRWKLRNPWSVLNPSRKFQGEAIMKSLGKILLMTAAVLCAGSMVMAQDAQERPTLNKDKQPQQQTQQQSGTTLSLDTPATAPALSEEDTA